VFGVGVQCDAVTQYRFEVESFSLIRHHDGYFIAGLAAAADAYFSFWIFLIAMHDCVIQRFPERQLNVGFCSRNTVRSFNQPHQAVDQR